MGAEALELLVDSELDQSWAAVLACPTSMPAHEAFLNTCTSANKLQFAAARYKEFLAANPRHPVAEAARTKLTGRMIAVSMVTLQGAEPEVIPDRDINRFGLSLIGLNSVLVSFSIQTYVLGFVLFVLSLVWSVWSLQRGRSKKPATDAQLARRRLISGYVTMADMMYSAFVIVQELKYGNNVTVAFVLIACSLLLYVSLIWVKVFGVLGIRLLSRGVIRRYMTGGD